MNRLEDSKASMEQLRDVSSQGGMRLMLQESKFQSGTRMEHLEEDTRGSHYMAGNLEEEAATKEAGGNLTGLSSQTGAEMTPRSEMALDEKVAQIELMTKILNDKEEQLDNLNDTLKEKEKQLDLISLTLKEKEKQLENLTAALQEKEEQLKSLNKNFRLKEELLESLQKNNTELTVMIEDLKEEAEAASSKSQEEEARLRGEFESATSRALELQDQLNTAVTERRKAESALQDARDQSVSLMNQLEEAKSKLSEVEMRSLEETGHEVVEEVRRAREEREDLMRGMNNLHSIIESGQRQLEEERHGSEALRNDMEAMERQLAASTKSMEKLAMALDERQEKVDELEAALEQTGRSLRSKEDEVSSLLQTQLLAQGSSHTTELLQEKHELERQLEKITKDMTGVEKVVTEMTRSFKHQVQVKEGEARAERERAETLSQMNAQLEQRCSQLEAAQDEERQREEGSMMIVEGGRLSGSVEDLSRQLQHELDLSSELDNSLLSQVAAMDTSSSSGLSEVQRLLKKIQNDGIKVLSLSERLFLMKHSNLGSDMASVEKDSGEKERQLDRRLGMVESQLEQEKTLTRDLRAGLEAEKKLGLDSMARLGAERQERQEMEQRMEEMAREVRELRHLPSDSDNAEFLDTIEAQKLQVLSLEESLQQERETLSQLQQLLEVERSRGRRDPDSSSGGRLEEVTAKLRQDLNKERGVRKRLEDSVSLDEVGQLVVRQLHLDLQHERTQVCAS